MWNGYLEVGGNEVVNSARSVGYTRTANCPVGWLRDLDCGGLVGALGDEAYEYANITAAPWYDANDPATARFLGVYAISVEGVSDSTREAEVSEGILDGGVVGNVRHATRSVRVRAVLSALGEDALEAGLSWLNAALDPNSCGTHGSSCGAVDVCFFASCPPPIDDLSDEEDYEVQVSRLLRRLHNVTCTSGPIVEQKLHRGDADGYVVDFILTAGTPWVFGETREIEVATSAPVVVSDLPYNLVPVPSAELGTGSVVFARNLAPNPSVETNATNWTAGYAIVTGADPNPYITSGRSTEVFSNGVASFRTRLLGASGTGLVTNAESWIVAQQTVTVTPAALERFSFSLWGSMYLFAGASGSALLELRATVAWRTGTTILRTDLIGTTLTVFNGYVFSAKSILPPAGVDNAQVQLRGRVRWSSSATPANNSEIRLYADAVAMTVP